MLEPLQLVAHGEQRVEGPAGGVARIAEASVAEASVAQSAVEESGVGLGGGGGQDGGENNLKTESSSPVAIVLKLVYRGFVTRTEKCHWTPHRCKVRSEVLDLQRPS